MLPEFLMFVEERRQAGVSIWTLQILKSNQPGVLATNSSQASNSMVPLRACIHGKIVSSTSPAYGFPERPFRAILIFASLAAAT